MFKDFIYETRFAYGSGDGYECLLREQVSSKWLLNIISHIEI